MEQVEREHADAGNRDKPQRSFARRWGRRLLALFVGLLVASLLFEVIVLLAFGEQPKFPRRVIEAPWGLRYNEPHAHYRHKSADVNVRFRINGQGMRADREYAYAKPANLRRIVSLGDSFTVGYEVEVEETFSAVLERELKEKGISVEVLNAGVSGFSTAEECLYLERELIRYEPDAVLLSFYENDLDDNVRTGLFALRDGALEELNDRYVPGGSFANFLNTNWFFNFLSEHSNAFVLAKERVTWAIKGQMVESNLEAVASDQKDSVSNPRVELQVAILERLYQYLRAREIPLVIHSIPTKARLEEVPLSEMFPLESFDTNRPGVFFLSSKTLLDPHVGQTQLYWYRSHGHWTPFSHEVAGKALADLVESKALLRR